MDWKPIETLPDGKVVILYQPKDKDGLYDEGMIISSIRREKDLYGKPYLIVEPAMVGGYEYECEITHPTDWAECPSKPGAKL